MARKMFSRALVVSAVLVVAGSQAATTGVRPPISPAPGTAPKSISIQTGTLMMTGARGTIAPASVSIQTATLTMTGVRGTIVPRSVSIQTAPLTMTGVRH